MSFMDCYKENRKLHTAAYSLRACISTKPLPKPTSLVSILHNATRCPRAHIYIRDRKLDAITIDQAREYLAQDKIHLRKYIPRVYDCDDFADDMYVAVRAYFREQGINVAWANLWDPGHALNGFLTKANELYLVEPQTALVYGTSYLKGRPRFIKM